MSMNACHLSYGIVTNDKNKAEEELDVVVSQTIKNGDELLKIQKSSDNILAIFKSGKSIKWINPSINTRGYRLHGAYVDEALRDTDAYYFAVAIPSEFYNEDDIHWFS